MKVYKLKEFFIPNVKGVSTSGARKEIITFENSIEKFGNVKKYTKKNKHKEINARVSKIEKKLLGEANDSVSEIGSKLHPNVPEWNVKDPARGIFKFGNAEVPLKSGAQGPGEFLKTLPGGPGTGLNAQIPTHVEGHVSGLMHKYGIKDAELFINKPPCATGAMCRHNLNRILPPDSKLTVHFLEPDGKITTWLFEHDVPKWKVIG